MSSRDPTAELELARRYDQVSDPQFAHGQDLIELLALRPGDRVLDIGAGTGRLAAHALKRVGATGRVAGIEPDAARVDLARKSCDPRIEFRVGRVEDLFTLRTWAFDAVYMNSSIQWVENKPVALAEIHRVLSQEGRLGITTSVLDRPNDLSRIVQQVTSRKPRGATSEEIRRLLQAARFRPRIFELRTYDSTFAGVDDMIEFLDATTFGTALRSHGSTQVETVRARFERAVASVLPEERRRGEITLKRNVLIAIAEKAG